MIRVRLSQLVVIEDGDSQIVRLEEAEPAEGRPRRVLTLVIGPSEAAEIGRCLRQVQTPRPLTHQTALALVEQLGGSLREVVIHDLHGGTYFAELRLDGPAGEVRVDRRPSDGIALALRADRPVLVAEQVLAEAGTERP